MFVKIRSLGISGFLDLAILPIRTLLGKDGPSAPSVDSDRKVALIRSTPDGVSTEEPVFSGNAGACEARVVRMIQDGERIVLEGFPLEQLAELCFKHNYRWRFHTGSTASLRFILEPGNGPSAPQQRTLNT